MTEATWSDLDVNGRILLKWILSKHEVNWIELALDRVHWRALMNTATNFRIP
jgi:folate-binding Fe-S cluster repair protein YgfZ